MASWSGVDELFARDAQGGQAGDVDGRRAARRCGLDSLTRRGQQITRLQTGTRNAVGVCGKKKKKKKTDHNSACGASAGCCSQLGKVR